MSLLPGFRNAASSANRAIPGPRRVLGGTGNVARYVRDPVGYLSRLFATYGPVVALARGGGTRVVSPFPDCPGSIAVFGPELVRQVKTPHPSWEIPPLTGRLYPLGEVGPRKAPLKSFATGLWGVQGDDHRVHRKLLLPAFHRTRVATYRDAIAALTTAALDRWRPGETIEVHEAFLGVTAGIATAILFGEEAVTEDGEHSPERIAELAWELVASPFTQLAPYDLPGFPYRRYLNLIATFDRQMRDIIVRRRDSGAQGDDVLSALLSARDEESGIGLTEDEVVGHVGSIFGAAHETTAAALTWITFLLSQHPSVASDLVDELSGELRGEAPGVEQLERLPLLAAVVKESLRIIPSVPVTWRLAAHAIGIDGYQIPKGAEVYASAYHTHHMHELYPRPESFDPRRWERITPSTYEYIPFGAGPRRCMGDEFALLEMKIVLSVLLQRYRLACVEPLTVDRFGFPVIRPRGGLPMVVHSQDREFHRGVGGVRGNVREMVELPA